MDFIERLFGIAPDGGSGGLEMLLALLPLAMFLVAASTRLPVRARRSAARPRQRITPRAPV